MKTNRESLRTLNSKFLENHLLNVKKMLNNFRTGEGVFEVQRRRPVVPQQPSSSENDNVRMMTAAEQKMDKNVRKIKKTSKIPKWNPNEWNIDDGKSCVRLKGRRWDDISVPDWARNFGSHGRNKESVFGTTPRRSQEFHGTDKRRWGIAITEQNYNKRNKLDDNFSLVPASGTLFYKKSKSVNELTFFSSIRS